jgi:transcriptional regulator GlxA family with amidase domain
MPRPQRALRSMAPKRRVETTHCVVMLAYPHAQILDITGPLEVFSRTSRWLREHRGLQRDAYRVELVAARAGRLQTSGGLELYAQRYAEVDTMNTLLIAGGIGYRAAMADRQLVRWIRQQAGRVERIGSICTGAFLLAAADLLNGKPATTHWAYCDELARTAPGASIERDAIYVQSGNLYTSAGVTSGMDMALAMVEADWGKATALAVAQELVMFLKRPGGQSQFSRYISAERRDDVFGQLELWMLEHLDGDLSVENLAQHAEMSPRHFTRMFVQRIGTTPAAYVRRLRVEQARSRIESGVERMKQVARECGFADEQNLRRAFLQVLGVTPADYRSRFS